MSEPVHHGADDPSPANVQRYMIEIGRYVQTAVAQRAMGETYRWDVIPQIEAHPVPGQLPVLVPVYLIVITGRSPLLSPPWLQPMIGQVPFLAPESEVAGVVGKIFDMLAQQHRQLLAGQNGSGRLQHPIRDNPQA